MGTRGRPRTTPLPEPKHRIRDFRTTRKWSISDLAKRTRIPAATIQKHETTSGLNTRYLEIYAVAFGVKTEELLLSFNTLGNLERELLTLFGQLWPENRQLSIRLLSQLRDHQETKQAA